MREDQVDLEVSWKRSKREGLERGEEEGREEKEGGTRREGE